MRQSLNILSLQTPQAQTQLREITEARDQLASQLQQHTTTMEELRGREWVGLHPHH